MLLVAARFAILVFVATWLSGSALGETDSEGGDATVQVSADGLGPNIKVTFSDIPEDKQQVLTNGVNMAHTWVEEAIKKLPKGRYFLKKWFRFQHFEIHQENHLEKQVSQRLYRLKAVLEKMLLKNGTECKATNQKGESTMLHVKPGEQNSDKAWVVNVCLRQMSSPGSAVFVRTLINQVLFHVGMDEHASSSKTCLKLPWHLAVQNAGSYTFFIYELTRDENPGQTLYKDGSGTRHRYCNTDCDATSWTYDIEGNNSHELNWPAPLKHCLACDWKRKEITPFFYQHGDQDVVDDGCGDGEPIPNMIEAGICRDYGCDDIKTENKCLEASKTLGFSYTSVKMGQPTGANKTMSGCHITTNTLFLTKFSKQNRQASSDDQLICMCPTPEEYSDTIFYRVCCTPYQCVQPSK